MLKAWLSRWQTWQADRRLARLSHITARRAIEDSLWQNTLAALPFVAGLPEQDLMRLRQLASLFLDSKEFSGAQGFRVTDAHAVMVAVQACLPILHIAPPCRPDLALALYDGFVGIVLHAGEVKARREWIDEDGIAHSGSELLTGEIVEGGPLMLAWSDVRAAGELAKKSYNVVIHEFIHVMDVRDGQADGCPPMASTQRRLWLATLQTEYEQFIEAAQAWQRFGKLSGESEPLIDPYGGESLCEFFAVSAEAYFVQRDRFAQAHPKLLEMFDGFFKKF
ncbi:MAG: zinc-dependent peptidase [Burkholderiales bacterium]|nr:MAG: zinc-dependent peptidase [Burkholderiales bacterium]